MGPLKAYLINLDRSPERLMFMREQFGSLGIKFERLRAVDGSDFDQEKVEAYAQERPAAPPEAWSRGAIGAFLSHAAAWQHVASNSAPAAAIFEDDVHLASDIKPLLASSTWIPADADIVRLEGMGNMKLARGRRIAECAGRRLHRALSGTWGSAGYVLTRRASATLLAAPPRHHIPADHFLFSPGLSPLAAWLRRYQVVPSVCIQDQLMSESRPELQSSITPNKQNLLPEAKERRRLSAFFRPHTKMTIEFRP